MAGQFDETFYRNKRAALLSSFLLLLANKFSLQGSENASIYLFKTSPLSHESIIVFGLLICLYLNLSYFLHYRTEVPAWRRDPETGLQEVKDFRASLTEAAAQSQDEQKQIIDSQRDMCNHLDVLSNALKNFVAADFPHKLELSVLASLRGKIGQMGEVGALIFNQASAAVHKDPMIAQIGKDHLKWDVLTNQIVSEASAKIVGTFNEQYERMLQSCRDEIARHMAITREGLGGVKVKEDMRLAHLQAVEDKHRQTQEELRSWLRAMNRRVRAQYFYLPVLLFLLATGVSMIALLRPYLTVAV